MKSACGLRRYLKVVLLWCSISVTWSYSAYAFEPSRAQDSNLPQHKVAVIIDDFGNGQKGTEEILSMPVKLTVAVMPFLKTSHSDAELAHKQGHDVLVHMPMEPKQGNVSWLGPGAITSKLSDAEIRKRVEDAIDDIPHAIGMNNHMGSRITGDERIMSIVLQVCKERGLLFVDSRTNYRSVAGKLSAKIGMPAIENNIFLDDVHTRSHITKQLQAVENWAKEHQICVTIGHVGTQGEKTAAVLKNRIPEMKQRVQFIGISDLAKANWGWSPTPIFPSNNQ
ncbi:divergent polysaccharide deacetylase family protein [Paenibacillus sp. IHBB 10380]|uniref:divergent polysaccharide deacetylase family protein n=1 Tax=Paenibacillus sp. IHBB 10380 TaxID=1566358 RepID=UPI0006984119|nr:divergent polysaccharide deacetylase family protein [Paenibacillus sp. IHBB 10380]